MECGHEARERIQRGQEARQDRELLEVEGDIEEIVLWLRGKDLNLDKQNKSSRKPNDDSMN